jgi:hypothetical protein
MEHMEQQPVGRYDGHDVLVLDPHGAVVPSVEEVVVDGDRAVVRVRLRQQDLDWLFIASAYSIRSAVDGREHWRGPVRVVGV